MFVYEQYSGYEKKFNNSSANNILLGSKTGDVLSKPYGAHCSDGYVGKTCSISKLYLLKYVTDIQDALKYALFFGSWVFHY